MGLFKGIKAIGAGGTDYYNVMEDVPSCSGFAVDLKNKSSAEHRQPDEYRKYDTLAWGYDGEGPELLAITILASALHPNWWCSWIEESPYGKCYAPWNHPGRDLILKHCPAFTEEIVANLPDSWTMTSDEVLAWIKTRENKCS